jgi:hypothetical protein
MEKKRTFGLYLLEFLFAGFGAAFCFYHLVVYPGNISTTEANNFLCRFCYGISGGLLAIGAGVVVLAFFLDKEGRFLKDQLRILLAIAFSAFSVLTIYQTQIYRGSGPEGFLWTSLALWGIVPLILLLLSALLSKKSLLASQILLSVAIVLGLISITVCFPRLFAEDYGEPTAGKGGAWHFPLSLCALYLGYAVLILGAIFSWISTVRTLKKAS